MDDYIEPFEPSPPPWWSRPMRCNICGKVYETEELIYDGVIELWACRDWPACLGTERDIELLDDSGEQEQ